MPQHKDYQIILKNPRKIVEKKLQKNHWSCFFNPTWFEGHIFHKNELYCLTEYWNVLPFVFCKTLSGGNHVITLITCVPDTWNKKQSTYCMSWKSWHFSCCKVRYKMGQAFLDRHNYIVKLFSSAYNICCLHIGNAR